ncbi:hypothetical protein DFH28DRAFT_376166 [Melampsora americana]|nr:hypothetical protein DFH28DRAFT_376166 [Melampsora americana]
MIRHFLKGLTFSGISYYLLQDQIITQTYQTHQTLKSLTEEYNQINSFEENLLLTHKDQINLNSNPSNLKEKIRLNWNQSLFELHSKVYNLNLLELFKISQNLFHDSNQSDSQSDSNKS